MATSGDEKKTTRLDAIDLLRGLAMIVMALDHTRDYFSNAHFQATDVTKTTPAYYLTRFVTHYCAPVFVFLAGTGAFLQLRRGKPKAELARFLLSRGLWLVFLELTFVRLGWAFNTNYHVFGVQVIWALGWSMVLLAPIVLLTPRAAAAVGVAIVLVHDLFDHVHVNALGSFGPLWHFIHEPGPIALPGDHRLIIVYPVVPWVGVMAAGFGFGALYTRDVAAEVRRAMVVRLGGALFLAFVVLRAINVYGDPEPWHSQASTLATVGAFFNAEKYPPSLAYLLMTLGPVIALLSPLESLRGKVADVLRVFGRVPLFYYLLHVPLIHGLAMLLASMKYGRVMSEMRTMPFSWHVPPDYGYSLPVVYGLWIFCVASLYPLCKWFAGVKQRNKSPWLSYL